MMNKIILIITVFTIVTLECMASPKKEWANEEKVSSIEFFSLEPLPIVTIEVNGKKLNCLIDEDDDSLLIDSEKAKSLGIRCFFRTKGELENGIKIKVGLAKSKEVQVGELRLRKVPTVLIPLQETMFKDPEYKKLKSQLPEPIDVEGIIGLKGFHEYNIAVSIVDGNLILSEKD